MLRVLLFLTCVAWVQADAIKPIERLLPPKGASIAAGEASRLLAAVGAIEKEAAALKPQAAGDVLVLTKAVKFAVLNKEFEKPGDVKIADEILAEAKSRLTSLKSGKAPWATKSGLTVRGFISLVDGSAQVYGVDVAAGTQLSGSGLKPCVVWLHGRGDKETDLYFIKNRLTKKGQFAAEKDIIVIHPFGRHCVGWKSTGEVDVLEAIAHATGDYNIDSSRIALMGFSMGGAGAWHLGAHYPDRWSMVHAGAGFVDVERYTKTDPNSVPTWERTLWGVYDVPDYARNLLTTPVIAYSGAEDKQKAAADIMEAELKSHGFTLPHIIGPKMGHKYDDASQKKVWEFVKAALAKPKLDIGKDFHFQTKTLRYSRQGPLQVTGLEEHWKDSRIDGTFGAKGITLTTKNITSFSMNAKQLAGVDITIDGTPLKVPLGLPNFEKDGTWKLSKSPSGLRKRPGLQGPMDDALLGPFMVVTPGKKSPNALVQRWLEFEIAHFEKFWREVFRGELRMKNDTEVTPEDMTKYHLILWGDPASNALIAKFSASLPIQFSGETIIVGAQTFSAATHLPALIYPNPAAPGRYIVLNNGCSFREGHCKTNAQQNPKLPDWAIFDLSQDPDATSAGKVVAAGFFDEEWKLK